MATEPDFDIEILKPSEGDEFVDAGETPDLEVQLYDNSGSTLAKASVKTLVLNITTEPDSDDEDGSVINSRTNVDVLDANNCTLSASGVATIRFASEDMAYQNTEGSEEYHIVQLSWTFDDSESVERLVKKRWKIPVRK